jgi:cysteine dioxygenase
LRDIGFHGKVRERHFSRRKTSGGNQVVQIQELVARLRCCKEADFQNIGAVQRLLRENPADPQSLERYLTWDSQHYTRNLIEKTSLFELLAICWDIGQASSVHNHQDQNCWMAAPIGKLLVQNYRVLQQDVAAGSCEIEPTDVLEMNAGNPCAVDPADPVHRVYNPAEFGQRAVSLHVYSRPYDRCMVYSAEQHKCGEIKLSYTTEYGSAAR